MEKRGLSAYDNKRYLLDDGVHTLAFGHRDIPAGAVEFDENVPTFDDEHIEARLAVDREMPPPARSPTPPPPVPLPEDPVDYVLHVARSADRDLPPLPGMAANDFELLYLQTWEALRQGREEADVRERILHCIGIVGDEHAFIDALLDI